MDGSFRNSTIMEEVDIKPTSFFLEESIMSINYHKTLSAKNFPSKFVLYKISILVDEHMMISSLYKFSNVKLEGYIDGDKTAIELDLSKDENTIHLISSIMDIPYLVCKPVNGKPFVKRICDIGDVSSYLPNSSDAIMKPYEICIKVLSNTIIIENGNVKYGNPDSICGQLRFSFGWDKSNKNDDIIKNIAEKDLKMIWSRLYSIRPGLFLDFIAPDKVKYQ